MPPTRRPGGDANLGRLATGSERSRPCAERPAMAISLLGGSEYRSCGRMLVA